MGLFKVNKDCFNGTPETHGDYMNFKNRIQRCFCKILHHLIPSLFTSKSESGPTKPKLFDLTSPFKNGAKHWNINRDRMGCGRFNHQCHGDFSRKI